MLLGWRGQLPLLMLSTVFVPCYLQNYVQTDMWKFCLASALLMLFQKGPCNVEVRAGLAEDRHQEAGNEVPFLTSILLKGTTHSSRKGFLPCAFWHPGTGPGSCYTWHHSTRNSTRDLTMDIPTRIWASQQGSKIPTPIYCTEFLTISIQNWSCNVVTIRWIYQKRTKKMLPFSAGFWKKVQWLEHSQDLSSPSISYSQSPAPTPILNLHRKQQTSLFMLHFIQIDL